MRFGFGNRFYIPIIAFYLIYTGCEDTGEGFANLEEKAALTAETKDASPITIDSFSPEANPVVVTEDSSEVLAIYTLTDAPQLVEYFFEVDGKIVETENKPFFTINGEDLNLGLHTVTAIAKNSFYEDRHIFNIRRNSPPELIRQEPEKDLGQISCLGGEIELEIDVSDVDGDSLSYEWLVADVPSPTSFVEVDEGKLNKVKFVPNCNFSGKTTVGVKVSDGYDTESFSWSAELLNPTKADIVGFSPSTSVVVIPSVGSQTFSYTGVGKQPLSYSWFLDDIEVSGATSSQFVINAPDQTPGDHTLKALLKDTDSEDEVVLTVRINQPPVITNPSPSETLAKINHASFRTFSIDASDLNITDNINYTWLLNDLPTAFITSSDSPTGSSAIFNPDSSIVGNHTLRVVASDGIEQTEYSWTVEVNYFSSVCNNLNAGEVCTLVGRPGIGHGTHIATEGNSDVRMHPGQINFDTDGNMVIADEINDVIWYYNKSMVDKNVVGQVVPAGELRVVAGSGAEGYSGDFVFQALDFDLHDPSAAWFDVATNMLFIADQTSDKVIRFDSTGFGVRIVGVGSSHVDGDPATTHRCDQPAGLVYDTNTDELFVSCYRDNQVKRFFPATTANTADINGFLYLLGTGSTDGTVGAAGSGRTRGPFGMSLAPNGDIYLAEYSGCRARVIHRGAGTSFYGSDNLTVATNSVRSLAGVYTSCDTTVDTTYSSVRFDNPRSIVPYFDDSLGTNLLGIFVTSTDDHRVVFVNNSGGDLNVGGATVADKEGGRVFGTGSANFNGDGALAMNTNLYSPYGIAISPAVRDKVYIGDLNNARLRGLDLSSGNSSTELGSGIPFEPPNDDLTVGSSAATLANLRNPLNAALFKGDIYFGDFNSDRIKKIDSITGVISSVISDGDGPSTEGPAATTKLRGIYGLAGHGDVLYFADNQGGIAANRNCQIRGWNSSDSDLTVFGKSLQSGWVGTYAGNYGLGCQSWNLADEGNTALNIGMRGPYAIGFDGSNNMYFTVRDDHCVMQIDTSGVISTFLGQCGSTGISDNVTVASGSALLRYPTDLVMDPRYPDQSNFFLADQTDQTTARIVYVNNSGADVAIGNVIVAAGRMKSLFSVGARDLYGIAAFENQICYASGRYQDSRYGRHNVTCKDRDTSFGTISLVVGNPDGTVNPAKRMLGGESEGVSALTTVVPLYAPRGIVFDDKGNLYIVERGTHTIRFVKKWY